jgi:predicted ATPase
MITYIKINGFKSFHNFEMEFTPFTVLAGANASGKSNLFDALLLLSRLAETDLKTAFDAQRGDPSELFTQYGENWHAEEMDFTVEMLVHRKVRDKWGGDADLKYTRLRYLLTIKRKKNERGFEDLVVTREHLENLKHNEDIWVSRHISKSKVSFWRPKVEAGRRGTPYIYTEEADNGIPRIIVPQDGTPGGNKKTFPAAFASQTVLSGINSVDFPHVFAAREEMRSWKFLQLNPGDLREPTRQEPGMHDTLTQSGKNLAAVLYRIWQNDTYYLKEISRKLNSFLPNFTEVNVYDDKANRQFIIKIKGEDGKEFSSRVLSEGTLRLLTLCIMQYDEKHTGLLCFEEPENGIHPFRIKAVAQLLRELSVSFEDETSLLRQVIVNTHSPGLVSSLIQWADDVNVSIWFSKLYSIILDIGRSRIKIKATRIVPVLKQNSYQTMLFSNEELKITLAEVEKYLQTADTENALKAIA